MLGVPDSIAAERRGVSLLPALAQPQKQLRTHAYAGSLYRACDNVSFAGTSVVEAIRDAHFKLIREESFDALTGQRSYIGYELYDLRRDAGELRNVYFEQRDHADRLERTLRARYPALPVGPTAAPCHVAVP
ncbi:MAG: hypothetical protein HYZ27_01270 [Deltaproteobacteria bacterium]|nr:hypothetical protein [Deltaproteobacteria bacterium]